MGEKIARLVEATFNIELLALLVYQSPTESTPSQFSVTLCKRFVNDVAISTHILETSVKIFKQTTPEHKQTRPNTAQRRASPRLAILKIIYSLCQCDDAFISLLEKNYAAELPIFQEIAINEEVTEEQAQLSMYV